MSATRSGVSGQLDLHSLEALIGPLTRRGRDRAGRDVVLDLRGIQFVTPIGLVVAGALAEHCSLQGRPLDVMWPSSAECRQYICDSGFADIISKLPGVTGTITPSTTRPVRKTILPLVRLSNSDEIPYLVRIIGIQLEKILGTGDHTWTNTRSAIASTIRELCENVFQHAGAGGCWIAGQRYRNSFSGRPYVEVAIADAGQGIRRSIGGRHRELLHLGDAEVIRRVLTDGLSRFEDRDRGTGYYVLQRATHELDGSFHLRSGSGAVERPRRGPLRGIDKKGSWPGTYLMIRLTVR